MIDKWEYKIEYICHRGNDRRVTDRNDPNFGRAYWELDIEKQLNKQGEAGWELAIFPRQILEDESIDGFCIFKRKLTPTKTMEIPVDLVDDVEHLLASREVTP